ncbi:MAG TPA: alpha/beta hydrolase-fold protein [Terriglobales bacterium]
MMKTFWSFVLLSMFVGASSLAQAAARVECSTVPSKILGHDVPYCALLPPGYDDQATRKFPVLYYLHGLGDSERSMVNTGAWNMYLDLVEQGKVGQYLIVTPAGYTSFYVNSVDGKVRYEDFFMKEFMPFIEHKYHVRAERSGRGLLGVSMGGYGAMRFAFKYPQLFGSVSTHMAALRESRPPEMGGTVQGALSAAIFGEPFDEVYYKSQSPFTLAKKAPLAQLKRTAIYFDCGKEDNYGFDVGNEAMDKLLTSRGIAHETHIDPGTHSVFFVAQHLPASLEFESKAFGLAGKQVSKK